MIPTGIKNEEQRSSPIESQILDSKTINALTKSATFAMSLGAKELFHTNFLGFLLESDRDELKGLQVALRQALSFEVAQGEQARCFVWREKGHLDLMLVPVLVESAPNGDDAPANRALVVEAKLKSIPTEQQLTRYREDTLKSLTLEHESGWKRKLSTESAGKKASRAQAIRPELVLLTPSAANVPSGWKSATWATVHGALADAVQELDAACILKPLLQDYVDSLGHVLSVVTQTHAYVVQALEAADRTTYGEFEDEVKHVMLRKLRLHDLAGKVAYEAWGRHLRAQLKAADPPVTAAKDFDWEVLFTKSHPGLTIEVAAPNGLLIGVQIQGGCFRHFIRAPKVWADLEKFAASSFLAGWFEAEVLGAQLTHLSKQSVAGTQALRGFGRDKFLYTSLPIRDTQLGDVQGAVIKSMSQASNLTLDPKLWPGLPR